MDIMCVCVYVRVWERIIWNKYLIIFCNFASQVYLFTKMLITIIKCWK